MKLEQNGRGSSGKRTRHINIRYFFVIDRIKANELRIKYCPTEMMVADFYTKPLQGKLFRLFRAIILNLDDPILKDFCMKSDAVNNTKITESQECVVKPSAKDVMSKAYSNQNNVLRDTYANIVKKNNIIVSNDTRDIIGRQKPSILRKMRTACVS